MDLTVCGLVSEYLDASDLVAAKKTCREWNVLFGNDLAWSRIKFCNEIDRRCLDAFVGAINHAASIKRIELRDFYVSENSPLDLARSAGDLLKKLLSSTRQLIGFKASFSTFADEAFTQILVALVYNTSIRPTLREFCWLPNVGCPLDSGYIMALSVAFPNISKFEISLVHEDYGFSEEFDCFGELRAAISHWKLQELSLHEINFQNDFQIPFYKEPNAYLDRVVITNCFGVGRFLETNVFKGIRYLTIQGCQDDWDMKLFKKIARSIPTLKKFVFVIDVYEYNLDIHAGDNDAVDEYREEMADIVESMNREFPSMSFLWFDTTDVD